MNTFVNQESINTDTPSKILYLYQDFGLLIRMLMSLSSYIRYKFLELIMVLHPILTYNEELTKPIDEHNLQSLIRSIETRTLQTETRASVLVELKQLDDMRYHNEYGCESYTKLVLNSMDYIDLNKVNKSSSYLVVKSMVRLDDITVVLSVDDQENLLKRTKELVISYTFAQWFDMFITYLYAIVLDLFLIPTILLVSLLVILLRERGPIIAENIYLVGLSFILTSGWEECKYKKFVFRQN